MRRWIRALAMLLLLGLLAGCSGLSYEELYTLPRASEDYYDLQNALNAILSRGNNYAAPAAGSRQEPVQLVDLDGDGVDEAVAFFRSAETGEVSVHILSNDDGMYATDSVIEGAGSGVASVEYADLDNTGPLEIIITYQVSESVTQALRVYSQENGETAAVINAVCSRYGLADMDRDGLAELVCLTSSGADSPAIIECYDNADGEYYRAGEQRLRCTYDNLRQTKWGALSDGTPTLACSGVNGEGQLVTDAFCLSDRNLIAAEPKDVTLVSESIHSYYAYPEDLNGDGVLDFPLSRQLPPCDEGSAAQSVLDWYNLSLDGTCEKVFTTYQNFTESWYLDILEPWDDGLTIKAADESTTVSTVTLFRMQPGEDPQEILTIYTLRGMSRQSYAEEHGLMILRSDSETIYAVSLAAAELWEGTANIAQVSEMFHYTGSGADQNTAVPKPSE